MSGVLSRYKKVIGDPAHDSNFTLTLSERWRFIGITKVARLTAAAVHPCDEESPSFAYLYTVAAHIESVDKAAADGALRLFDPISFKELPVSIAKLTIGGGQQCLVCWEDFVGFAASMGIEVRVQGEKSPGINGKPLEKIKSRQAQQEEEILDAIKDLGFDPGNLPPWIAGTPGVKSQVRKKLNYSKSVFDKAWERLRAGPIAEADGRPYSPKLGE